MRARPLIIPTLVAVIGAFLIAMDGLRTQAFSDYETEAEPAFNALRAGHLGDFLGQLPAYGGSLILRSPFVYLSDLLGGGSLSAYRAAALPCLAAGVFLGVYLFTKVQGRGAWIALAIAAFNPITIRALDIGHPEELLGGALCVGALLLALDDRPLWAGLLLGLAFANKPWALLALGPLLLALDRDRIKALAVAGFSAAVVLAPLYLHGDSNFGGISSDTATNSGVIFQPWQIWWFFGSHSGDVVGTTGIHEGYRTAPTWLNPVAHPLIAVMALPLTLILWRLKPRRVDALGLLALLLGLRCLLDPWDIIYYQLPFVLALLAWEVRLGRRIPVVAATVTALVWISFEIAPDHVSADLQALLFLAWAVPLLGLTALRVFAPARFESLTSAASEQFHKRLPTLAGAVSA